MIRAGLVGFGLGGRVFHAPLLASVAGIEFAAIVERSTNNAEARYPGLKTFRTLEAMLADASLDLIVVSTPSGSHFEIARQVIAAGRNLVVDKPMAITSAQIAQLAQLAREKNVFLAPFHNRRWDSDFLTLKKIVHEQALGRLVSFESRFDRWRPMLPTTRLWKESPAEGGGNLIDLGTHLADQALVLFGVPEAVSADVARERETAESSLDANDAFTIRLRYPGLQVVLGGNTLTLPPQPRYHLRGLKGNYWKYGLDPQEAALGHITRIEDPHWGREPESEWGTLYLEDGGTQITRPVAPQTGDYRQYYAGVRDALTGKATFPITALDAWRVCRLLEWAAQSARERREIPCNWSEEPK
jgi:predicted dehydrogenase